MFSRKQVIQFLVVLELFWTLDGHCSFAQCTYDLSEDCMDPYSFPWPTYSFVSSDIIWLLIVECSADRAVQTVQCRLCKYCPYLHLLPPHQMESHCPLARKINGWRHLCSHIRGFSSASLISHTGSASMPILHFVKWLEAKTGVSLLCPWRKHSQGFVIQDQNPGIRRVTQHRDPCMVSCFIISCRYPGADL